MLRVLYQKICWKDENRPGLVHHLLLFILIILGLVFKFSPISISIQVNRTSLSLSKWFVNNQISILELGLYLEYGKSLTPWLDETHSLRSDCTSENPRLNYYQGIISLLKMDNRRAFNCSNRSMAFNEQSPDMKLLLLTSSHLDRRKDSARKAYEELPTVFQNSTFVAAQAIFNYIDAGQIDERWDYFFHESTPRKLLFSLYEKDPWLARQYLNKAMRYDLLTEIDREDFLSFNEWITRVNSINTNQVNADISSNTPPTPAYQRLVTDIFKCAQEKRILGSNLLPEGLFDSSDDLSKWQFLPWTQGGSNAFNQGRFRIGLDYTPDGISSLRMSGLWKDENPDLIPAYGSLRLNRTVPFSEEKTTYLVLIRYKTENMRFGNPWIWFRDPEDNPGFVGDWRLEKVDESWHTIYAIGSVDPSDKSQLSLLINQFALGTVWIDYIKIFYLNIENCDVTQPIIQFGRMLEVE